MIKDKYLYIIFSWFHSDSVRYYNIAITEETWSSILLSKAESLNHQRWFSDLGKHVSLKLQIM